MIVTQEYTPTGKPMSYYWFWFYPEQDDWIAEPVPFDINRCKWPGQWRTFAKFEGKDRVIAVMSNDYASKATCLKIATAIAQGKTREIKGSWE